MISAFLIFHSLSLMWMQILRFTTVFCPGSEVRLQLRHIWCHGSFLFLYDQTNKKLVLLAFILIRDCLGMYIKHSVFLPSPHFIVSKILFQNRSCLGYEMPSSPWYIQIPGYSVLHLMPVRSVSIPFILTLFPLIDTEFSSSFFCLPQC